MLGWPFANHAIVFYMNPFDPLDTEGPFDTDFLYIVPIHPNK